MKRMDFLTVIGIVLGISLILGAIVLQGELVMFWSFSSLVITIGGSFSSLLIKFQLEQVRKVFKITQNVFTSKVDDMGDIIYSFINLSQKARREGLLSLEDDITAMEDPFIRSGLQMVVDGLEPELIRDIMETELESLESRHSIGQEVFKFWGASAPAFGMIGTLIGLIQMLANLDDVNAIGPGMAVALLTTLYGALAANLLFIPIAGKLAIRSDAEVAVKVAIIEGVLSIQAGTNPRVLQEKLKAYVSPKERESMAENSGAKSDEEVMIDNA
ncbi:motility protein A [Candidatus Contubernalis alkaliaceticus]|uniref:motility protein A n=1 Tax=Candidatus Contubernalis alkaliaceticus TaxID=338645 RepID=UPI001F4C0236|nr:MotA/TolQ/ExbB proton channel family protein [Candidatus Contubernalis alkalaceticus]UNC91752.1 MotA/TolQ/ExbB proton channel family protein [Candidatus Contubernalis alkalaceticus]